MIKIDGKIYYTPKEYADLKIITVQTVYNRIKNKELKTRKLMDKTLVEY